MTTLGRPPVHKKRRVIVAAKFTAAEFEAIKRHADQNSGTKTATLRAGLRAIGVNVAAV